MLEVLLTGAAAALLLAGVYMTRKNAGYRSADRGVWVLLGSAVFTLLSLLTEHDTFWRIFAFVCFAATILLAVLKYKDLDERTHA
jgi:ABC-type transport system involved in cytochrome c biogenesis permease subunit